MAGKDINIPITGDAREFIRETDRVEDALEDVADALDDMTRDTKRGGQDAERAVEDLEDSFRDAAKRAKDLGDAGDDAGKGVEKGMRRAEDGVDEFKSEAEQTAKETAASFDGSFESIADMAQEVAANAFSGFGPAGVVAGLAAAAGIGLAVQGFEDMNEAEKESRERAAEWADAYIEAGGRILNASQLVEKARAIITDEEQYKKAQENAKNWGVSESIALLAMAGDANALAEAKAGLAEQERRLNAVMETTQVNLDGTADGYADLKANLDNGKAAMSDLTGEIDLGIQQADVYSESLRLLAEHTSGATKVVDEFGDTIVTLPDGKQIYIDAETGKATENVNAIEDKIYGIPDGNAKVNVSTADAQSKINRFVEQNQGRTIKINGRFTVTSAFGNGVY